MYEPGDVPTDVDAPAKTEGGTESGKGKDTRFGPKFMVWCTRSYEELRHVPALVLPPEAEVEAHSVSHLPFRSWYSACVRGRGLSPGHRRVDAKTKDAEQIPVDHAFFGQPEDRAHDTLPVLIVRDRKSNRIWSHPVPSKGVVRPYPARALMADLDFTGYKRVILKSDQEPSIVALCDADKNGWHGEVVPEASPKGREQK